MRPYLILEDLVGGGVLTPPYCSFCFQNRPFCPLRAPPLYRPNKWGKSSWEAAESLRLPHNVIFKKNSRSAYVCILYTTLNSYIRPRDTWGWFAQPRIRQPCILFCYIIFFLHRPVLNFYESLLSSRKKIFFRVITRIFRVITRMFRVITRIFRVITRMFRVITRIFRVITRIFRDITRMFRVITRIFRVITRIFRVITRIFRVITRIFITRIFDILRVAVDCFHAERLLVLKARSHQRPDQPPLFPALEKWTDRQWAGLDRGERMLV